MTEYAAFLGIDWADKKHDVCLSDTTTGKREAATLPHSPHEIDHWATALRQRYAGHQIAVCLEQSRGPLIYALMKYDFITLYPVNPRTRVLRTGRPSLHRAIRTTRLTRPTWPTCSSSTASSCAPGNPMTSRPALCVCSSSTAADWWVIERG